AHSQRDPGPDAKMSGMFGSVPGGGDRTRTFASNSNFPACLASISVRHVAALPGCETFMPHNPNKGTRKTIHMDQQAFCAKHPGPIHCNRPVPIERALSIWPNRHRC